MFEKEAKEFKNQIQQEYLDLGKNGAYPPLWERIGELWVKGAEFGYNKANEWHYMKDVNCYEDLHFPPEEDCKGRICIWKVKDCSENYHCGSYGDLWYEMNAYHVIAWKEIVLPEEADE